MNHRISKILCMAAFAATAILQARAGVGSKAIVVESPSDLPEFAQNRSEAMYLKHTESGMVVLYLEQNQGRKLAILDVTDPAKIRAVGQVSIDAPSSYDFVQDVGYSAVLIHYRNHSGFGLISFKKYKQPVLKAQPDYMHPARVQTDGPNALLFVSSNSPGAQTLDRQYEVISISNPSGPTPLATIPGVFQRLDRPGTGTIFLLNDHGLSVIRCLAAEQEHETDINSEYNQY
jgi:hypothetical protein